MVRATGLSQSARADSALGTLVATVVIFAASVALNNSSMYDPYWSLQPLALAGYYIWIGWGSLTGRQILVTILVLLYAVRLTATSTATGRASPKRISATSGFAARPAGSTGR